MHGNANCSNRFSLLRSIVVYVYVKYPYKSLSLLATASACPRKEVNTPFHFKICFHHCHNLQHFTAKLFVSWWCFVLAKSDIRSVAPENLWQNLLNISDMTFLKEPFSFVISTVVIKLLYKAHRWDHCASTLKIAKWWFVHSWLKNLQVTIG